MCKEKPGDVSLKAHHPLHKYTLKQGKGPFPTAYKAGGVAERRNGGRSLRAEGEARKMNPTGPISLAPGSGAQCGRERPRKKHYKSVYERSKIDSDLKDSNVTSVYCVQQGGIVHFIHEDEEKNKLFFGWLIT